MFDVDSIDPGEMGQGVRKMEEWNMVNGRLGLNRTSEILFSVDGSTP